MTAVLLMLLISASAFASAPDAAIDEILRKSVESYAKVSDYTCMFDKVALVSGALTTDRNIFMKYMKPDHVYMRWTEGDRKGREVIFVKGEYDDQLQAHPGDGWNIINVSLDPKGKTAMRDNLHPITESGIGFILGTIVSNYERARTDPQCSVTLADQTPEQYHIKASLAPNKGYYSHLIDIWVDRSTYLPVKVSIRDWNNVLIEEYAFKDIRINTGMTETDFDMDNPAYKF